MRAPAPSVPSGCSGLAALGASHAPDETLLRDRPILVSGLLYAITAIAVMLLSPKLAGAPLPVAVPEVAPTQQVTTP